MSQFEYRAKKGPEKILSGTIEAETLEDAIEKLDILGLLPIHLEEARSSATAPSRPGPDPVAAPGGPKPVPRAVRGGVKSGEITLFGRQLSSLIKSGVPILRALWIISEQVESGRFKKILSEAQDEIRNGKSLSGVLEKYPRIFPPIYIALIRAGEDSGTLQETLLRVSEYRKREEELLSKVRAALVYPALMLFVGIGTIVFMMAYVIPKLTTLFSNMGGQLPLPTQILMNMSTACRNPFAWGALALLVSSVMMFARFNPRAVRVFRSHASLRIPGISVFVLKAELSRFTRTLELLIRSGIPILRALEITTPVVENTLLRGVLDKTLGVLTGGGSLGKTLKDSRRFPLFMTNLISVGEESGNLDGALGEIASYYEQETEAAVKVVTSLVEPLMILGMGLAVGFIVIAMMLPMFELNMMVR